MQIQRFKRVVVVGSSGSGKTAFARALSEILGAPHIELDAHYWGPNWVPKPDEDLQKSLTAALDVDAWVFDGNLSSSNAEALKSATAIVWLNYSFPVVFGRAVHRTFRRIVSRERLYSSNHESLVQIFDRDWIPWWVIRTFWSRRQKYRMMFSSPAFSALQIFELKSPKAGDELLARLRAA